ncbi:MAG: STAS domain-containing protein [Trebonia sp.]
MTHLAAEDINPATFTVTTAPGDAIVVALDGDLDMSSVPAVRERLLSLLSPSASRLIIDMSAVRYADASGLEALVSTRRRAVLLGGTLHLAALRPEVASVLTATGLSRHLVTYRTVRAAAADLRPGTCTTVPEAGRAVAPARALPARTLTIQAHPVQALPVQASPVQALPVQAPAGLGADSGELHAAVAALLASADAWRDADPRRRFSVALNTLAQAAAGTSHAALVQAARSLLTVLSREPLTYSPVVAATASRLRRVFPAALAVS